MDRRRRPLLISAVVGGAWGLAGYAVLWGHTPIVIHRPFVVSGVGTALLFPVRVVLWGIRVVEEEVAGAPFDFSRNDAWIGATAGLVGAVLLVAGFLVVRAISRRLRPEAATAGRAR
jgi:energy-converting hydrogenase Eha subunit A